MKSISKRLVGAQVTPANLFLEGIDHVLDTLQERAAVNTLIPTTHTYWYGASEYPGLSSGVVEDSLNKVGWPDHGVPLQVPEQEKARLTRCHIPHREDFFQHTPLRHLRDAEAEYFADRDVLAELAEPLKRRGMKVIPRILEGFGPNLAKLMPNWPGVFVEDIYGRPQALPCFNHPDYRHFWVATIQDMFTRYDLDGLLLGFERGGPLAPLLFHGHIPHCFCRHCRVAAEERGISVDRAREGFRRLYEFYQEYAPDAGNLAVGPEDGFFLTVIKILMRYPEILAWHRLDAESKAGLERRIYGTVKSLKPDVPVGWFIPHYPLWHDIINRADLDYGELSEFSDFLRPCLYYAVTGTRLKRSIDSAWGQWLGREFSADGLRDAIFRIMGWNRETLPDYAQMAEGKPFAEDWVRREMTRCRNGVKPGVKIYPSVGIDIGDQAAEPTDQQVLARVMKATLESGADGIVVGRYYHDMTLESMTTAGNVIREHWND